MIEPEEIFWIGVTVFAFIIGCLIFVYSLSKFAQARDIGRNGRVMEARKDSYGRCICSDGPSRNDAISWAIFNLIVSWGFFVASYAAWYYYVR